jgi:hypothetical protein
MKNNNVGEIPPRILNDYWTEILSILKALFEFDSKSKIKYEGHSQDMASQRASVNPLALFLKPSQQQQ